MTITLISSGYFPGEGDSELGQLTRSLAEYWAGVGVKVTVMLPLTEAEEKSNLRAYSKRVRLKYQGKTKDYNIWVRHESPLISLYFIEKSLFFGRFSDTASMVNGESGNLFYNYAVVNTLKLFDSLPSRVIALGWQSASAVLLMRNERSLESTTIHYIDFGQNDEPLPSEIEDILAESNLPPMKNYSELGLKLATPTPPDYPVWSIAFSNIQPKEQPMLVTQEP